MSSMMSSYHVQHLSSCCVALLRVSASPSKWTHWSPNSMQNSMACNRGQHLARIGYCAQGSLEELKHARTFPSESRITMPMLLFCDFARMPASQFYLTIPFSGRFHLTCSLSIGYGSLIRASKKPSNSSNACCSTCVGDWSFWLKTQ